MNITTKYLFFQDPLEVSNSNEKKQNF